MQTLFKIFSLEWHSKVLNYLFNKLIQYYKNQVILNNLNKIDSFSEEKIIEFQVNKLNKLINYARAHCGYYREIFDKIGYNDFSKFDKIPLLDKQIIRNNYDKIVSDELSEIQHYKMNTGGSTGEPLEFPVSPHFDPIHQEFYFRFIGYTDGDLIVAFDGSSIPQDLRENNIFWVNVGGNLPYGSIAFSSLYLNEKTIKYYILKLLELKPNILRGYPSFLNDLAIYILENKIELNFSIKGVQLTAENANSFQINNIKKAFNTKIYFQYGHSEVSVFAYTRDDDFMYVCSPFYGFTEVLDENGKHVKNGEVGEIVVTGFFNYALPFIRYKTGDLAIYKHKLNGIVYLEKITGRSQDFIIGNNNVKTALTALIFGQHYKAFKNIIKWQIIQDIPGIVQIKIVRGLNFSQIDEDEIRLKFKMICNIEVSFLYVNEIALSKRGKFQFLIQKIS